MAQQDPDTWTVAGSSIAVFGTSWDVANTANDMTETGSGTGIFQLTKNNVTLPAGNITFKVVKNHNWNNGSYPQDDYVLTITTAGIHNITITFNASTTSVSANDELVEAEVILPTVKVAGGFVEDGWTTAAVVLTPAANKLTATGSVTVPTAGSYNMKLKVEDDWKTLADVSNWITRVAHAEWEFSVSGGTNNDTHIDMDMAGEYTFTYTFATRKLDVTYPQTYTRHFDNAYYSTICLPQAATLTNATAYEVASIAGGYVSLSAPVANLAAGKPYIILPSAANVDVTATLSGNPTDDTTPGANGLWGVLNIGGTTTTSTDVYILSENAFHKLNGGTAEVPRFRGGLTVTAGAPELRIIENTTDIQNVEANKKAVKFIENGRLLIMKEGVVYDVTGAVVR